MESVDFVFAIRGMDQPMRCKSFLSISAVMALAVAMIGCGGHQGSSEKENPALSPIAPPGKGKPVDMATVGEVTGTVQLDGTPPRMHEINMAAVPNCARQHSSPPRSQEVVLGNGKMLQNVVVYLKGDFSLYSFPETTQQVEIDQKGCMYVPHVIALRTGQPLRVVNSDPTTHNIHPMPKYNREWNESEPPGAAPFTKIFTHPEVAIPVKCNVHPWMKAYIAVLDTPYYQVTGNDGTFDLKDIPPGTYTLVAWQEYYGTVQKTITINPKQEQKVDLTFNAATAKGD
jgi:plastocyanin